MAEFYYSCSINEAITHSPFEVMHGYQPSTLADRLFPLAGAAADAAARLTLIADTRDVANQLLKLSKERMAARSTRAAHIFQLGDLVYLSTKELHIRSQKCKHLSDQKLAPCKVISKVDINFYKLLLPKGCRLHPVFIVIYCLLRPRPPFFDLIKQRLKVIMRNKQLILSRMSELISG
jgi:hypothetical protein